MLRLLPVARSTRAASTCRWQPPPSSRWRTAVQQRRSGARPAQARRSNASRVPEIWSSAGASSGAHEITAELYLCLKERSSAIMATASGLPRRISMPGLGRPAASTAPST